MQGLLVHNSLYFEELKSRIEPSLVLTLYSTSMSKSPSIARRSIQFSYLLPLHSRDGSHNQLRNSIAVVNFEICLAKIYQHYLYLTSIVSINSPRAVNQRNTVFKS